MLVVSFLVRVLLFPLKDTRLTQEILFPGLTPLLVHGIRPFYNEFAGFIDYPPFNVYLFWAFGSFGKAVGISTANIVKLIPNVFDLATAVLIYVFVRKQASFKSALLATGLYTFNPAVIYNTAIWGQYDAIYTFFLDTFAYACA